MRRPGGAAPVVVLLFLWLTALTFAFHGCGSGLLVRRGSSVPAVERDRPASLARKMLLAVESRSLDPSLAAGAPQDQQRHHHHHRGGHHHRQRHHRLPSKWNWQRVPPAAAPGDGEEIDPRYGVEKRLVPTGPNPLHH